MDLIYAIALEFNVPNEQVCLGRVIGNTVWFTIGSTSWTCTMTKNERLKKNSIRRDF